MKIRRMFVIIVILLIAFISNAFNGIKKVQGPVEIHFQVSVPKSMSTNDPINKIFTDALESFHKINQDKPFNYSHSRLFA